MVLQTISRLKIQHVAFGAIFLCFILVNANRIHDPDMWWHLKAGEYIFTNQTVPDTDFYSFSNSGHPWIAHEWGSELLYYLSYQAWKFRGLFTVNLLFLSVTFYLLGRLIYTRADRDLSVTTVILTVSTVFSSFFWVFRPHLLGYLFLIAYMIVLEMYFRGKNYLWVLPPIMVLWVNMHGSFIMGIVLICIYLLSGVRSFKFGRLATARLVKKQFRDLSLILLLVAAAVVVNPNTLKMYYYPFFTLNSSSIVNNIAEWSSPDFHEPVFKAFLAYLFLVYATLMISRKAIQLRDILVLGLVTYLAMFGVRNIALFVFATGPMWAEHLTELVPSGRPQKQIVAVNWLLLAAVVAYGIYGFPPQQGIEEGVDQQRFPVQAVRYMQENHLDGSLFNDYDWGGYLIWARFPGNKVFIDGRTDIYEDRVLPDYMSIMKQKPGSYQLLLKYNPKYIILPATAPVNQMLQDKTDWKVIYRDKVALIYGRNG